MPVSAARKYCITFARTLFRTLAIKDAAALILHQSFLLYLVGAAGSARTARAEDMRKEFLGQIEDVAADRILCTQEPAAHVRFDRMPRLAGCRLLGLQILHRLIAADQLASTDKRKTALCIRSVSVFVDRTFFRDYCRFTAVADFSYVTLHLHPTR